MDNQTKQVTCLCIVCNKARKETPLILQCNHAICFNCLQECFNNIISNYIECPSCKKFTSLDFFEKELDDFASTPSTPQRDFGVSKQQPQSSNTIIKGQSNSNQFNDNPINTNNNNQIEKQMRQSQQEEQSNQIDDFSNKHSQEVQKSLKQKNYSVQNPSVQISQIDPNTSNGVFLNSFEISSILPQNQHHIGEQNFIQNYNSPQFSSTLQSYTHPTDIQLVNVNNFLKEQQRRDSLHRQENQQLPDHSQLSYLQQLQDNMEIDTILLNNNNDNDNNNKNYTNAKYADKANNNKNDNNNDNNKNESVIKRSNSSMSNNNNNNLYTLQGNNQNEKKNKKDKTGMNANGEMITQTSSNANQQSSGGNESFSQSFLISSNQNKSFNSVSGVKCKQHPDEEANLFCFECHCNCICIECFIGNAHQNHKNHDVSNVRKSFGQLIPLVYTLKEAICKQIRDLKSHQGIIVRRETDISSLCEQTVSHMHKQVQEVIDSIILKRQSLSDQILAFQNSEINLLQSRNDKINKQLINLQVFSDSYDKILNFQGKCSEARMFNYFSDTKSKVNKYISKLEKQNEEIRTTYQTKYTSCYPEHIFSEIQNQIQQIQIPFTLSEPLPLPSSLSLGSSSQETPMTKNYNISSSTQLQNSSFNRAKNSNSIQPQNANFIQPQSSMHGSQIYQKKHSQQFEDQINENAALKESKIIDFNQYKLGQDVQQAQWKQQQQNDIPNYGINQNPQYLHKKQSGSLRKVNKDSRQASGHTTNLNSLNNSYFYDQNLLQNSQKNFFKQTPIKRDSISDKDNRKFVINLNQRLETDQDDDNEQYYKQQQLQQQQQEQQQQQQQLQMKSNPFNMKSTQFQFTNSAKNNIVKLKLQQIPFVFPPEIQTSDSIIIQNLSTKSIKSTNRKSRISNNENIHDNTPVPTSVKDCVQLIKNTLKSRGGSHSQLRERNSNPGITEPFRYKSALKENRYSVPKLDTKKIQEQIFISTLTQKSTERERISGKSNDKKIRELKKILNEGW